MRPALSAPRPALSALRPALSALRTRLTPPVSLSRHLVHGHSVKKNTFCYGPEYAIYDEKYYKCKMLPKIISNQTEMFRFYSCIFKVSQQKKSTARAVFNQACEIANSYTIETSNGSFISEDGGKSVDFNEKLWTRMGELIGVALHEYVQMSTRMANLERLRNQVYLSTKRKSNIYQACSQNNLSLEHGRSDGDLPDIGPVPNEKRHAKIAGNSSFQKLERQGASPEKFDSDNRESLASILEKYNQCGGGDADSRSPLLKSGLDTAEKSSSPLQARPPGTRGGGQHSSMDNLLSQLSYSKFHQPPIYNVSPDDRGRHQLPSYQGDINVRQLKLSARSGAGQQDFEIIREFESGSTQQLSSQFQLKRQ